MQKTFIKIHRDPCACTSHGEFEMELINSSSAPLLHPQHASLLMGLRANMIWLSQLSPGPRLILPWSLKYLFLTNTGADGEIRVAAYTGENN